MTKVPLVASFSIPGERPWVFILIPTLAPVVRREQLRRAVQSVLANANERLKVLFSKLDCDLVVSNGIRRTALDDPLLATRLHSLFRPGGLRFLTYTHHIARQVLASRLRRFQ